MKAAGVKIQEKRVRVLGEPGFSLTAAVDRLVWTTDEEGFDVIVAFTHSRKGLKRLMMGSFAETLLYRSEVPVLLVGPSAKIQEKVKKIVWADDLSSKSQKAFEKMLSFARELGAEVILYHGAQPIYEFSLAPSDPAVKKYRGKVDKELQKREALAKKWGVSLRVELDSSFSDIAGATLKLARTKKAELVVTQAKSGVLGTVLLGSVTRQILRDSELPVLVIK